MSEDKLKKFKKFPHEDAIKERFKKFTKISDPDIDEALRDLTGDTYFEMRKLESQCLSEVESIISRGLYSGYQYGIKLTDEQREELRENPREINEDLREFIRTALQTTWRDILIKQKMGIDKLGIALSNHLINKNEDQKS